MREPATPDPYPVVSFLPDRPGRKQEVTTPSVLCVYCQAPIVADPFAAWFPIRRPLFAPCPDCHRRMIVPATTWLRWSGLSGPVIT